MKLYDTLSREVKEIKPLQPPAVTVYTCGPTVYDYPHIGNWFTFIRYDLLVRTLRLSGYEPKWVMNITDVGHLVSDADDGEDKLEKGAAREGKTAWDVAKFYGDYFIKGLKRLNFSQPSELPKATDHIAEQIELVQALEAKGFTYVIDDGIYYDTSKFPQYADFARLDLDEQQAGARVEVNAQKRNPTDFALWKFSPGDRRRDMEWDSPWGKGFPGWHLECSAMARKYLGDTLDIHSGGIDHVPVHHTNETAQSEAVTGQPLANLWMHTNHILIEDEKISKSLGNGITLEDIEAKGYSLEAFRLHVLESHYRSQSKFSWESLEAAQNSYKKLEDFIENLNDTQKLQANQGTHPEFQKNVESLAKQFKDALLDDLNTPRALAVIFAILRSAYTFGLDNLGVADARQLLKVLDEALNDALGLKLPVEYRSVSYSRHIKEMITQRDSARAKKDFKEADRLRKAISDAGFEILDTPNGPTLRKKD